MRVDCITDRGDGDGGIRECVRAKGATSGELERACERLCHTSEGTKHQKTNEGDNPGCSHGEPSFSIVYRRAIAVT